MNRNYELIFYWAALLLNIISAPLQFSMDNNWMGGINLFCAGLMAAFIIKVFKENK